jgi:branched-chain amino acid transport system permease protein
VILGLADAYATGYLPKSSDTGIPGQLAPYLSGFRPAMPIIILFVVLLLLPQSKLRGHSAARSRERFPMPTYRGSLLAAVLLVGAVAIVASLVTDADALQLSKVFGFAIIALSLVPLVGYGGQISLCQMSFAGIGAIVMSHHGVGGSPVGLVYAAVICAIVGAIVALPALRLSGLYLALGTGAFAVILDRWIFTLPSFDIGPIHVDLFGALSLPVDRLHIPGVDPSSEKAYLVVVAAVFAVMAMGVVVLRRSRYGDRYLALKDSPAACATLGLNLTATKLGVFALSAAMAGVGGAIYAGSLGTVSPERFSFFESLPLLLLAVVGGIGSAGGAVFAGIVLFGIPIVASTWATLDIAVQSLPGAGDLTDLLKVTPGLMGIGLAKNPNGVVPDLASRFEVVRGERSVLAALGVALAALVVAAELEVLGGWWFGTLAVVAIFATIPIAETIARRRAGTTAVEEVPLEWLGVVEPYTEADLRRIDEGLHLPDVVSA